MNKIEKSAEVHQSATIGSSTSIWHFVQIREGVEIGSNCTIGRSVYIGPKVRIGNDCKIQNNSAIYDPAKIGDGVFIGPGVVLTNDRNPRAIKPSGEKKELGDWETAGVEIQKGASIGAGAICVSPVVIGAWSLIGAGSVVTKDVPNFALVAGNPAQQIGWVGRAGHKLKEDGNILKCPKTGETYVEKGGILELIFE